jgi:hypothetical protein
VLRRPAPTPAVYPAPAAGLDAVVSTVRAALLSYLFRFFPFAGRVVRDLESQIPVVTDAR